MQHITQTTDTHTIPTNYIAGRISFKKLLIVAGILIAVLVLGTYALLRTVYNQLPGDSLYGLKTATEKIFGGIQLTSSGRIDHNIALLESRLNELNRYALGVGSSSPEQLTRIVELSDTYTKEVLNTIAADTNMAAPTRIALLTKLNAIVRAEETLSDSVEAFSDITDTIATNEKRTGDALRTAITDFVAQNATTSIEAFIADKITTLGKSIGSIAPGSSAANAVANRISEIHEAVIDQNYKDAIVALVRAEQAIAIDGYLWGAERGPVDGVPVDNGPIPEGN